MAELIEAGKAQDYEEFEVDLNSVATMTCHWQEPAEGQSCSEVNDGWQYEWRLAKTITTTNAASA
jgi:hypothetical protein